MIFNSCSSVKSKKNIDYVFKEYSVYHHLSLLDDYTFSLQIDAGMHHVHTNGNYSIKSDTLHLLSFEKFRHGAEVRLDSITNNDIFKNEINIHFINYNVKEVYCSFKNGEEQLKAINNNFKINLDKNIDTLKVSFWGETKIMEIPINIPMTDEKSTTYYTILTNESAFYINKQYKIDKRKLIDLEDGLIYKRKQTATK